MKKSPQPPRLASRIFEWYCSHGSVEDLHGDLDELFYSNLKKMSPGKARFKYWLQAVSLIFSYAITKRKKNAKYHYLSGSGNSMAMISNYFKVASRNLSRQRFFTIINILGLSIGMSFSLLLLALLSFLFQYDSFFLNSDSIYRVTSSVRDNVTHRDYASVPDQLAEKIKHDFAGVKDVVRINRRLSADAIDGDKKLPVQGYFVDDNFFDVFSFTLEKGNRTTALTEPNSIVVTKKAAQRLFDKEDPVGKVITLGEYGECTVTGVVDDLPKNSHLQFEVLGSYATLEAWRRAHPSLENDWKSFRGNYVYFTIPEKKNVAALQSYLTKVSDMMYATPDNFRADFTIQSLNDIVPGPELYDQIEPDWSYTSLAILVVLTMLILVPACFNYATISISRALKRAKEIGLRKVVGGQQSQIFFQFITETVIITFISLIGAYGLFAVIRNEFMSMLTPSSASSIDLSTNAIMLVYFVVFALIVGFVAGGVPALYFSRLNPVQALKNNMQSRALSGTNFRKVMIVIQFALSIGFIMSVVVIVDQYRSALNHDFGFNQENILDVELQDVDPQLFKNEMSKLSAVQSISMSSSVSGTSFAGSVWIREEDATDSTEVEQLFIDENYISNLDLQLIAGRNFTGDEREDKDAVIVNEEFLKFRKLIPSDVLGKTMMLGKDERINIIGVAKDFHYKPITDPIQSFFFRYDPKQFAYANIKITSPDINATIEDLEAAWKPIGGELPFKSKFLTDEIAEAYDFYFSMVQICGFLGGLAISISCLGLLGMVVYTAETRTKEVGVRKVMGASTFQLAVLLSKGYVKLIALAALIAVPVTYFLIGAIIRQMRYYSDSIGVVEILLSLLIVLVLGLVTILSQTWKAARSNPVDTLRYE